MEIEVKHSVNQGDELPFVYVHPKLEGKLLWVCGRDKDEKITSVFSMKGEEEGKCCHYLEDMEAAKRVREELVNEGWIKYIPPRVTFTFPPNEG